MARAAVLDVLRREDAHLPEATHTHVRFSRWRRDSFAFARDGYVGLHAHTGEPETTLRVVVRATAPRRALVWTSAVALAAVLVLFAFQPRPWAWVAAAAVLWPAWIAAVVIDLTARAGSRSMEQTLLDDVAKELRERGQSVLTPSEVRRRRFEEEIEGEIAERRLRQARSAKR